MIKIKNTATLHIGVQVEQPNHHALLMEAYNDTTFQKPGCPFAFNLKYTFLSPVIQLSVQSEDRNFTVN